MFPRFDWDPKCIQVESEDPNMKIHVGSKHDQEPKCILALLLVKCLFCLHVSLLMPYVRTCKLLSDFQYAQYCVVTFGCLNFKISGQCIFYLACQSIGGFEPSMNLILPKILVHIVRHICFISVIEILALCKGCFCLAAGISDLTLVPGYSSCSFCLLEYYCFCFTFYLWLYVLCLFIFSIIIK